MLGPLSSRRASSCQSAADGNGFEDGPTHPCSLPAKLAELQLTGGIKISVPESRPTVDTLKAYPAVSVDLEGYTDSTGDAAANKKLSALPLDACVLICAPPPVQVQAASGRLPITSTGALTIRLAKASAAGSIPRRTRMMSERAIVELILLPVVY